MSEHPTALSRQEIIRHMRVPIFAFVGLMLMLVFIVALGAMVPSRAASFIEFGTLICMVLTVLLFSMELPREPPLMRLFAGLGFVWLLVLFSVTMLDYLTR